VLDAFRELIDELISAPQMLKDAGLESTNDPAVLAPVALVSVRDLALIERIQATIRQDTPLLKAPPDISSHGTTAETVAEFDRARGELVSLLMNLTLKDWERTAIDWNGREISVADDVESHVEFDEDQIEAIVSALQA
jgi:hypothetical protein